MTCHLSRIIINFSNEKNLMEVFTLVMILDWLCRAMRMPGIDDGSKISTATYGVHRHAITDATECSQVQSQEDHRYELRGSLKTTPLPKLEHNCWQLLLNTHIVADIVQLRHPNFGKGLEMSFDLMISLAAAEYHLVIEGGIVFIGYQTVIFPTAIQGDCAQFHLLTGKKGQINPYTLDLGKRVLTNDPSRFKKMRCFLGWCEAAQINLGTKHLPATVKYSKGREKGVSLNLDGCSVALQIGASSPLSTVLGLQTNFKYTSHHRHFTPSGGYSKLLQETAQELAIVYDAGHRRCWLVPKLSLILHMSPAYALRYVDVLNRRVPYVNAHTDAVEIVKELESLGDIRIHGEQRDGFLFRELMLGLNINLLSTVKSVQKSSGKSLYGFEFMDVVTTPGRGACMKSLDIQSQGRNWLDVMNVVDAVVVCSDLGEAITAVKGRCRKSPACNSLPKSLDYLAATLPCLVRLVERKGEELKLNGKSHRIKISEESFWDISGNPFLECQHDVSSRETCWMRDDLVQRLRSKKLFRVLLSNIRTPKRSFVKNFPLHGAVVFGA